ncbi:hypothetical protein, partial [Ensifer aridi]|uniref:hypothetical protein n=1 Tax=Ensifer aridi TaxID=1708715 RepID=UPI001AECE565
MFEIRRRGSSPEDDNALRRYKGGSGHEFRGLPRSRDGSGRRLDWHVQKVGDLRPAIAISIESH